jgi:hypothetical protein
MEKEFFDLLGLGVPFYLGAATYGVFAWLDNNASDEATKVITYWLHGRSQDKPDLGNLIISVFDRIYTLPLLSFRAFRRSAAISSIIWLLFAFVPTIILLSKSYPSPLIMIHFMWVSQFFIFDRIANLAILVVVDYISLFFVRLFLGYGRQHPTGASLLSSLIGLIVVIIGYFVFTIIVAAYIFPAFGAPLSSNIDALLYYISIVGSELLYLKVTGFTVGMVPALAFIFGSPYLRSPH